MPPLIKRFGFNKTMIVTSLLFASIFASLDAYYVYPVVGFPTLWLLFGVFHLLAAANNVEVYFRKKEVGPSVMEQHTKEIILKLKRLSFLRRMVFLIKISFFNFCLAIYGFVALFLFGLLLGAMDIGLKGPIPYLLLLGPPIMIIDLILLFPIMVFGSLIISWRKFTNTTSEESIEKNHKYLTVSTECLENALAEAKIAKVEYVKFLIPEDE